MLHGDGTPRSAAGALGLYVLAWTIAGLFFFTQDLSRKAFWGDLPAPPASRAAA
jgi:hypothetical protein